MKLKILYIEDSHDLAIVVLDCLKKEGHEVEWIDNRGKLPADFSPFDFVLSDFQVPGGDFHQTKELCEKFAKPLLLVSGDNFGAEPPHPEFLPKPFSASALTEKIVEVVRKTG